MSQTIEFYEMCLEATNDSDEIELIIELLLEAKRIEEGEIK